VILKPAHWFYSIVLLFICLGTYDLTRWENSGGDTISARYWPVSILEHGTWKLDPFQKDLEGVIYTAIYTNNAKTLYPRNGWGVALFTVPFYAIAHVLNIGGHEWTHDRISRVSRWNSVFLSTFSVILLFLFLSQIFSLQTSFFSSLLFALGTWNWSMAPQGLYSQTMIMIVHILNVFLLWKISQAKDPQPKLAFAIGIAQAVIWSIRPQDFLLVMPSFLVLGNKRNITFYLSALVLVIAPLLYGYKTVYGFYSGAYGVIASLPGVITWSPNAFANIMGLLFSPNRGAIVFFPLLLLVPYYWKMYLSENSTFNKKFQVSLISGMGLYLLVLSFLFYWHGGWAYGGRYLYNILPYVWIPITFMINDIVTWIGSKKHVLPRWALVLSILCAVESVFVHGLGHYNFDLYVWNYVVRDVNNRTVWDFDELLVKHTWDAGSNAHRWDNTNALKRLREYGF
jgi:hypothetical protein